MIQVENLVKRYGKKRAVDGLSFHVKQGQIYGFLGPNGAGKSTTMNIMTGYMAADEGTVMINGFDMVKEPLKAKECIGYLPEVPPLYQDMTVWEYLMFVAELKKVSKNERIDHVEEVVNKVRLEEHEERLIKHLSKGYKQRVGLAQALVGNPRVIILDEPMVGMDPKQIIEMRDLIKGLGGECTVILSSHILSEVSAICDHIMILSEGRLAASGSPEELQDKMRVKTELEVTVAGEKEQAKEVLEGFDAIEAYAFEPAKEADGILIRISLRENTDIRKELSVALAEADMPIMSMSRQEQSLEDIFLALTGEQEAKEAVDDESDL